MKFPKKIREKVIREIATRLIWDDVLDDPVKRAEKILKVIEALK